MGEMSAERMHAGKRKASDGTLDSGNVGFWAKLKPIVTARRCRPACNQRLLEFKADATVDIEGEANLITEHAVDVGILGSYFSSICVRSVSLMEERKSVRLIIFEGRVFDI